MPEPPARPASSLRGLDELFAAWGEMFDRIEAEMRESLSVVDEALWDADSEGVHPLALAGLTGLRLRGERSIGALTTLIRRVEELQAEWRTARRYQRDVLERRAVELAEKLAADAVSGAHEWLKEVFDALDVLEWEAAKLLSGDTISWPDELAEGAAHIRAEIRRWHAGEEAAGFELMELLGEAGLEGWSPVLSPELRARAHRLAAWVSLRRLRDESVAEQHLGKAVELWPYAGRMHAERAAYYLSIFDLDRAASDGQRAIELAKDDAAGYLELGIWAELSGDFEDADEFYRTGLDLLPLFDVARLGTGAAIIDPPGRLLSRAAEVLYAKRRPRDALEIANRALDADMRGPELHPQFEAYRVRSMALEQIAGPEARAAAAAAAAMTGKLYLWNGDVHKAIEHFQRAEALDDAREEVGWLLADAILTTSLPLGRTEPDQSAVTRARETWERWAEKVGLPRGDTSWAYVTRAQIADLETQARGAERFAGMWEALLYVEKAIVHDDADAQRWGYASQYLRYVYLDELAFEASDRGYRLGAGDRQVLAERLAQLVSRGRFEEAEHVAEELVTMFGNDPSVSAARAWLAIHGGRKSRYADGLGLLELPLAEGNDPSWYYEMRALCHVGLEDVPAAREDFRRLLEHTPPIGGTTKCRLAMASVVVADADNAARWSEEASKDPTARPMTCRMADAFAAFAQDDTDTAVEHLTRATERAASGIDLRDIVEGMLLRLPLLSDDGHVRPAHQRALQTVADGPVKRREQWLAQNPLDPDRELDAAIATHVAKDVTPGPVQIALWAVRARRNAQAGRHADAVASYQALLGTSFEPEATLGLTRALRALAEEQAAVGEVDYVRRLMERMAALTDIGPAEAATAVASAMERTGDYAAACEQLEGAIADTNDDRERAKLHQRAGGLALARHDLDRAAAHFGAALNTAKAWEAHGRTGQLEIRMALIAILNDDVTLAGTHLFAAAKAWKEGGAVDPTAALVGELHGLQRAGEGNMERAACGALRLVERAVGTAEVDEDLRLAISPLRRLLNP